VFRAPLWLVSECRSAEHTQPSLLAIPPNALSKAKIQVIDKAWCSLGQGMDEPISRRAFTTKEDNCMVKHFVIFSTILLLAGPIARASDQQNDNDRMQKAGQVLKEIMDTPDKGIPHDLLDSAKCIAVIPGDKKFAFIFGGSYGRGVVTCRTTHGWSAPMFLAIEGGSVGYQIGGSSTDLIMLL
jgi:hypothetical protein